MAIAFAYLMHGGILKFLGTSPDPFDFKESLLYIILIPILCFQLDRDNPKINALYVMKGTLEGKTICGLLY